MYIVYKNSRTLLLPQKNIEVLNIFYTYIFICIVSGRLFKLKVQRLIIVIDIF